MSRQRRLSLALESRSEERVDELGVIGVSCYLTLWLDTGTGLVMPVKFLVDSGASYSMMNLELALDNGLPIPPPESEAAISLRTAQGRVTSHVRPGRIRGWWNPDCSGHPFDFPILFRVNAAPTTPTLLGLGGVVRLCRWTFDGTPTAVEPYGTLTLDDIR
jgi:hypothetical protein